jgi:hypothetical protein
LAVAALTTVAAGTVAAVGTASAESNGGVRVMPLGDSITDGVGMGGGGYRVGLWQRFTQGGYRVDFVGSLFNGPSNLGDHDHEGRSGWRIDQLDANVVGWLLAAHPHAPHGAAAHRYQRHLPEHRSGQRPEPVVRPD